MKQLIVSLLVLLNGCWMVINGPKVGDCDPPPSKYQDMTLAECEANPDDAKNVCCIYTVYTEEERCAAAVCTHDCRVWMMTYGKCITTESESL